MLAFVELFLSVYKNSLDFKV